MEQILKWPLDLFWSCPLFEIMSLKSSETFDIRHPNSYQPKLLLLKSRPCDYLKYIPCPSFSRRRRQEEEEGTKTHGFPLNFCCFMHEGNDRQNNTSGIKIEKGRKQKNKKMRGRRRKWEHENNTREQYFYSINHKKSTNNLDSPLSPPTTAVTGDQHQLLLQHRQPLLLTGSTYISPVFSHISGVKQHQQPFNAFPGHNKPPFLTPPP